MSIIIDLRGTSGSGKSTCAKRFLDEHASTKIVGLTGKHLGYTVMLTHRPLFILGRYTSPTGGCDTIPDMDEVIVRINHGYNLGYNVLLEGLRTSGVMGRLGANSVQYGPQYIFAFLDTPLTTCVKNINARRAARGALPLKDHKHTYSKFRAVESVRRRVTEQGRRVLTVNWLTAKDQLLEVFNAAG